MQALEVEVKKAESLPSQSFPGHGIFKLKVEKSWASQDTNTLSSSSDPGDEGNRVGAATPGNWRQEGRCRLKTWTKSASSR